MLHKRAKPGDMISVEEAAVLLGVTRSRVHQLIAEMADDGQPVLRSDQRFRQFYTVSQVDVLAYRDNATARRPGPKRPIQKGVS